MTPWRKFLDRLLLASAGLLALLVIFVLFSMLRTIEQTQRSIGGDSAVYASQLEYDAFQLLDHIEQFQIGETSITADDVRLRFDIVWSRVFNPKGDMVFGRELEILPQTRDVIDIAQTTMTTLEPQIAQLDASNVEQLNAIEAQIREILPVIHANVLATLSRKIQEETSFLDQQLQQKYVSLALILGMGLFGVFSTILLRIDGRRIHNLNTMLEDRVSRRTGDLQAANAQLGAEISERKRTQTLAAERETRLAQAVQLAKLGYYIWDAVEERCEFCSELHAATRDMTPAQYIEGSTRLHGSLRMIHIDDREKVRANYRMLRAGHMIEMEYRVPSPSGVRRIREVARPVLGPDGQVIRELGSSMDVTDQYETEMKLFEAQRMDSIGKMTGGVAHDFNNLLAVILGNLELLQEFPESDDRDDMISDAIHATLRGRDLTMSMLSFARRAPLDPNELNMNVVLSELEGMLRRTLPENINFRVDLPDDVWTVMADRSQTESAVLNLAINARDAMEAGGELCIKTSNVTLDERDSIVASDQIGPGHYVKMTISDTGDGIDDALLDTIFDPFFTTKAITKNSGLGLSMVQGFIVQTGGAITVESHLGRGTVFELYFQAVDDAETNPAEVIKIPREHSAAGLRVLLIEDDESVRKVLTRQLEVHGLKVAEAAECESAQIAFAEEGPFDVIVSDIVMPGALQGPALVKKLRLSNPDLPAIFLSGYPQAQEAEFSSGDITDLTLMKPVEINDLLRAIRSAMG